MKKPHIIIFNPDEMRWDTLGHMGNPAAFTPNLDRFAAEDAVSFSHAYCQNPVCVPSRCSFLTGRYPHNAGHRTMQYLLRTGERSLFQELMDQGYYVWMNGRNDFAAGQIEGLLASHANEIYFHASSRKTEGKAPEVPYSHYRGVAEEESGHDAEDTAAAVRRILDAPKEQPLCLFLGLSNPHPPYVVERRYYEQIPEAVPERIHASETQGKNRMMEVIRQNSHLESFPEEKWRDMRRLYLAQCAKVDDLFGQIVAALKEAGMYEDSAIFVLSDHGDFAGDYDLPEKAQNCMEDVITRVPLLIKPPKGYGLDPGVTDSLAELVDFYATALDFAGVEPVGDHFGRSLKPVIADRKAKVRDNACCEGGRLPSEIQCDEFHSHGPEGTPPDSDYYARLLGQCDAHAHEKATMITDGRYKYVERLFGDHEFYDLLADPGERINLYPQQKDSALVIQYQRALLHWYQETCDLVPRDYDSRALKKQAEA